MGGGSSGTQTVVQQDRIPQYLQDFSIENQDLARQIAGRSYTPYEGQRIAGLSGHQAAGLTDLLSIAEGAPLTGVFDESWRGLLDRSQWFYDQPPMSADDISAAYGEINPYLFYQASTGYGDQLDPGDVEPWMSPYIAQALQPQIDEVLRQSAGASKRINAGAASAGAFGDARTGIQQGELDRNTMQMVSDVTGTGYRDAYDRAVSSAQGAFRDNANVFFQDRASQLRALDALSRNLGQEHGTQLDVYRSGAGQFNADRDAQLRSLLGLPAVAEAEYGYQSGAARDLLSAGEVTRDYDQSLLTTAYQDFLNQMQYPQEMLNLRLATQAGSPYSTTRLTSTPYSPGAQNIGALAALFSMFGRPAGSAG